MNPGLSNLRTW